MSSRHRGTRHDRAMKISLGTDHAGFQYKEKVKTLLTSLGHEVKDFGTFNEDPVDYPVFIRPAAEAVARGECERGIVFGGSGNGEAMAANKVHGVRCALCWNEETARLSRQHNDANVLSIGQRVIPEDLALKIVRVWLETPFEGGRHEKRVEQLRELKTARDTQFYHERANVFAPVKFKILRRVDQIESGHPADNSQRQNEWRKIDISSLSDPGADRRNRQREPKEKMGRS